MSSEAAGHKTGGEKKEKKKIVLLHSCCDRAENARTHTHTRENPNKAGKGKIHKEQLKEI